MHETQVKQETSLAKVREGCTLQGLHPARVAPCRGRLKAPELTTCGRVQDMQNASLVLLPSVSQ
jgi:hypothetical protein